jgi:hypothetical protein
MGFYFLYQGLTTEPNNFGYVGFGGVLVAVGIALWIWTSSLDGPK